MAYTRPIVMVYQEFADLGAMAGSADLPVCIIGPCYHIVRAESDLNTSFAGDFTESGLSDGMFPNVKAGVTIEEDSVEFLFKYVVGLVTNTPIAVEKVRSNEITFKEDTYPTDIKIGDLFEVIKITPVVREEEEEDDSPQLSTVKETISEKNRVIELVPETFTIRLARTIPEEIAVPGNGEVNISREFEDFTLFAKDTDIATVKPETNNFSLLPYSITEKGNTYKVTSAKIFTSYRGLRTDLCSTLHTMTSADQIEANIGETISTNPLAMGVKIAMANTTSVVNYIGVNSDDLQGYINAKAVLTNATPMYAIVPLTQKQDILSVFKTYVTEVSQPEVCRWAVCIGSMELQTKITVYEGVGSVKQDFSSKPTLFYCETANFMTDGVIPTNKIIITYNVEDNTVTKTFEITKVTSEDTVQITSEFPAEASGEISFYIEAELTKEEQAQNLAQVSSTWNSYRYINIYPGQCIIEGETLPSYYLACAIGGMTAGLPPHQGFTFITLAGIEGVTGSWDYFTAEQLDTIAGGGTFIIVQDNESTAPYVRHQLTTDMSATDYAEFSSIKNFDYVSYYLSDGLDVYLGSYNVIPEVLNLIASFLTLRLNDLARDISPKIGAPITSHTGASVIADPDYKNGVIATTSITTPNALNRIILKISKS